MSKPSFPAYARRASQAIAPCSSGALASQWISLTSTRPRRPSPTHVLGHGDCHFGADRRLLDWSVLLGRGWAIALGLSGRDAAAQTGGQGKATSAVVLGSLMVLVAFVGLLTG